MGISISSTFCTTSLTHPHHILFNSHTIPITHSQNNSWVIDSGAIDHITSSLNFFLYYSQIKPVQINLPNGTHVFAHFSGSVQISPNFVIHDVLYIPNFKFNLLSISKLMTSLNYFLIFSNENYYIQETRSLKTIGLGKLKQGLYHLDINHPVSLTPLDIHKPPPKVSINTFTTPYH